MNKIKCIKTENGTIIPIHNIAIISGEGYPRYILTNADVSGRGIKHDLSDAQYNVLLNHLKFI